MTQEAIPQSKQRVAVLCGARSTEHEVSLVSAYNIVKAMDKSKYDVFVVGITKSGDWYQYDIDSFAIGAEQGVGIVKLSDAPMSGRLAVCQSSRCFYDIDNGSVAFECDVVFPAVLGSYAEDGTMQGLLRMMDVPFTTADVLGSSTGMDKDVAYRLLREAGIPVAAFTTLRKHTTRPSFDDLSQELSTSSIFIKPANAGSSVGVSQVSSQSDLESALDLAFLYDTKVIAQAAIKGREIEISVTGNFGEQKTSLTGEVIEKDPGAFYSYEDKYINVSNVELVAPAKITDDVQNRISQMAVRVCETLECEGFGRVDFFVDESENIYVNEINTMPGFTRSSMFPRLWEVSGVTYPELIDWLIRLAIERYNYRIQPMITDANDIVVAANNSTPKF